MAGSMALRLYNLLVLILVICFAHSNSFAQSITNGDGSALTTKYCWQNENYQISGQPQGGTFSGCGMFEQNGTWYFNPIIATQNISVFPYQCPITYTVNGASVTVPILVWKPVVINPPLSDTVTCNGYFYLHANTLYAGAYWYSWSPAGYLSHPDSANTAGQLTQSQSFVLTATDITSGCVGYDTVSVIRSYPPQITAGPDTTILPHQQVQLWATGGVAYQWNPDKWLAGSKTATPVATPEDDISYTVTGKNEYGCTGMAELHIHLNQGLFFPNAFSPNGDGINDEFKIENFGFQKLVGFRVFNRYGQLIFFTTNGAKGWDGTQNGKACDTGTYYYLAQLSYANGTMKTFKGSVTLIR